jgi:tetratricopeptide (TPR) repeat protein
LTGLSLEEFSYETPDLGLGKVSTTIKPDKYEAWYNRGIALRKLDRYAEAIASFDKALEIALDYVNAISNKAYFYAVQGDLDQAIAHLQQAIAFDPNYREMAKTDTDFDRIRDDQRFQALLEE